MQTLLPCSPLPCHLPLTLTNLREVAHFHVDILEHLPAVVEQHSNRFGAHSIAWVECVQGVLIGRVLVPIAFALASAAIIAWTVLLVALKIASIMGLLNVHRTT